MSQVLSITLPDTLYETLTKMARQTGQPLETVATKWLTAAAEQFRDDPLDPFIGMINSGGTDWADHHDHYVGQMVLEGIIDDTP